MAFKLMKKRDRERKKARVERDHSVVRIPLNFGLSPRRPPVIFVKKRVNRLRREKAGQSKDSPVTE